MSTCPCGGPTQGWICNACLDKLRDDVRRVPDVLLDLSVTARRQDVHGGNGGGGSTGSKPPVNLTASMLHLDIEVMLRAMFLHVGGTSTVTADRWMAELIVDPANFPLLAAKACVIEYAHQLPRLLDQAIMLIDTPANTIHLGICPTKFCGTELTARENDTEANCPTCGHEVNIRELRTHRILTALGDDGQLVRASEAVRRFTTAGLTLTVKDVENWVKRGKLHPTSVDEHKRRLYNLTDLYTNYTEKSTA